jgi:hypothetical protein
MWVTKSTLYAYAKHIDSANLKNLTFINHNYEEFESVASESFLSILFDDNVYL